MGSGFVVLVVLLVLAGIGLVIYGLVQAAKRREAMATYAASRGWRYEADQPMLVDRFDGAPFGIGNDRQATNAVYGQHDGRDFVSFDYEYETTSGSGDDKRTTTHNFSIVALSMGVSLPSLRVDPENFLERLWAGSPTPTSSWSSRTSTARSRCPARTGSSPPTSCTRR